MLRRTLLGAHAGASHSLQTSIDRLTSDLFRNVLRLRRTCSPNWAYATASLGLRQPLRSNPASQAEMHA